ncbi:hypothetical protein ZWY2020_002921 [Hordeum vulgare]|nr:hypothetical protein ZWY2020_002921 [Hordeum vulgare]
MWNDDLKVVVHATSFHCILDNVVHLTTRVQFCLVCIYGDPYHMQTTAIWSQVSICV